MSHNLNKNAFTLAIGATALAGAMVTTTATANPFEINPLSSGYQVGLQGDIGAKGTEGKCGEGKCGGDKAKAGEGKCGEGKCGGDKAKAGEGKCGEGKCGGDKAKAGEGKCGEGKCGMEMLDADKDGKVTKDEFMAAHEKMFAAKDANSDGVLEASEMTAAKAGEGKCGEGKCGGKK